MKRVISFLLDPLGLKDPLPDDEYIYEREETLENRYRFGISMTTSWGVPLIIQYRDKYDKRRCARSMIWREVMVEGCKIFEIKNPDKMRLYHDKVVIDAMGNLVVDYGTRSDGIRYILLARHDIFD